MSARSQRLSNGMDKPDTALTTILEPGTEKAKQRRQIAGKEFTSVVRSYPNCTTLQLKSLRAMF